MNSFATQFVRYISIFNGYIYCFIERYYTFATDYNADERFE
jgi:hypothetical protein